MLKICILGYGGIARVHRDSYKDLEAKGKAKLVAVCDIDESRFDQKIDINIQGDDSEKSESFNTYLDLDEMLEKEKPDIVTVTLPTFLHTEKTIYLLEKGYNVMCEKPMSLTYEGCKQMLAAAEKSGKLLMIGQCLHFASEYEFLKEAVESGKFGKVRSAFFQRISSPPLWSWENWYMNTERSGGCIYDLHIHDIDFVRYAFGEPKKISCISKAGYTDYESAFSTLWYDDFAVTAIGDWSLLNYGFAPSYRVAFEKAVLEWKDYRLTVYPTEGEKYDVALDNKSAYGAEVEYMCDILTEGFENKKNAPESAALTIKLVQTLKKSADNNGDITEFNA